MSGRNPVVEVSIEGRAWRLIDAGRSPSGLGLGYFASPEGSARDRRVALEPASDVTSLAPDDVVALWQDGAPLTPTERRLADDEGELWLAQAVGPVWAEGGTAADAVGVRLRCLTVDRAPVFRPGRTLDQLPDPALRSLLAEETGAGAGDAETDSAEA